MSDSASAKEPSLTTEEIQAAVVSRLKRYDDLNFFERFAMFMGIAQILELQLKQLLERQFGVPVEKTERKTRGQVSRALRERGLRSDFLLLLDSVVEYRNHVAHELLASQFILTSLGASEARFETRILDRATYELEQLWFLYEWTEQHNAWQSATV